MQILTLHTGRYALSHIRFVNYGDMALWADALQQGIAIQFYRIMIITWQTVRPLRSRWWGMEGVS